MPAKKRLNHRRRASAKWRGQQVLVVMKDGSYYIGTMRGMDRHGVTLSAARAGRKMANSMQGSRDKAQVSGILTSLLFGGASLLAPARAARGDGNQVAGNARAVRGDANQPAGNGGGMFGFLGQMVPHIRVGMNMVRSIMPLMGLLRL